MSRQNRLNAGAEYVLCRIWATLLNGGGANGNSARRDAERPDANHPNADHRNASHRSAGQAKSIHAESLLACLGALAGYACQAYVRRAAMHGGADRRKYAFTTVTANDGTPFFDSDALNVQLAGGPVSTWALVGLTVQKFGSPPPDIDEIFRYVAGTVGTSAFGVPRAPAGHRPRHLPIVYLKQLWPQILPIAQPFCRRASQLPVLFGIALQRAIEHTRNELSPSLGANIAMECAVAMARVVLPAVEMPSIAGRLETGALPGSTAPVAAGPSTMMSGTSVTSGTSATSATFGASAASATSATFPASATSGARGGRAARRRAVEAERRNFHVGFLAERLAPARNILTIMSLAIVAMAGTMWSTDRNEAPATVPTVPREVRLAQLPLPPDDSPVLAEDPPPEAEPSPIEDMQVVVASNDPPVSEEIEGPPPIPEQPVNEGIIAEDGQSSFDSGPGGETLSSGVIVES